VLYVFETHALPRDALAAKVIRACDGVVVSSRKLAEDVEQNLQISPDRILTAYLAPNALPCKMSRVEACHRLGLPGDKRHVVYTGKLLLSEVKLLLKAASCLELNAPGVELVLVGGNRQILAECRGEVSRRRLRNVRFAGFVPPAEVGVYQAAADVLVLYL